MPTRLAAPPNIVVVVADDLGWGDVPARAPRLDAPNMVQLARDGMTLNRFYAAAPVCSPTRMSLLTGRHPFRTGTFFANSGPLPPGETTIAELVKLRGYRTGFFGKWHVGRVSTDAGDAKGNFAASDYAPPWRNGFDTAFATTSRVPSYDPMVRPLKTPPEDYWLPLRPGEPRRPFGTGYWTADGARAEGALDGDDSRLIVEHALDFVRGAVAQRRPFLTYIWFHAPHLPLVATAEDRRPFADLDPFTQAHHGAIRALDRQIGVLRAELDRLGVSRNTLLIFTSDNGPERLSPGAPGSAGGLRGVKRSLYEGGIRVPAFAVWPGRIIAGSHSEVPMVSSDLPPTIARLVGAKLPRDRAMDGRDLSPLWQGRAEPGLTTRPIAFESTRQLALIEGRWKLVSMPRASADQWPEGVTEPEFPNSWASEEPVSTLSSRSYELYDLVADPSERNDLAVQNRDRVAQMIRTLTAWRASVLRSLNATRHGQVR